MLAWGAWGHYSDLSQWEVRRGVAPSWEGSWEGASAEKRVSLSCPDAPTPGFSVQSPYGQ